MQSLINIKNISEIMLKNIFISLEQKRCKYLYIKNLKCLFFSVRKFTDKKHFFFEKYLFINYQNTEINIFKHLNPALIKCLKIILILIN